MWLPPCPGIRKKPLISSSTLCCCYCCVLPRGVSGVGVLDDNQDLIANLSASDLRCIQPEHFGMLGLPVAEFLALLHGGRLGKGG